MALPNIDPTSTKSWQLLEEHFKTIEDVQMKDFFARDDKRANTFKIQWDDFYVDFSKNRIDEKTLELLLKLAEEVQLKTAITKYFNGDIINETENRAVLHTALRAPSNSSLLVDGENI